MEAVILAGGKGSRLSPITGYLNKHLLPVFNKPMIFYPISVALLGGARKITIVCNPADLEQFSPLKGMLESFGIQANLEVQHSADGIAAAILCATESKSEDENLMVLLGDNITYGPGVGRQLQSLAKRGSRATCFTKKVDDPERFGVLVELDGAPVSIVEKPGYHISDMAIIGLYIFPADVRERIASLTKSKRGELEVSDLLSSYLSTDQLDAIHLSRSVAWIDAGTPESLLEASTFVQITEKWQGVLLGSPHEAALSLGLITKEGLAHMIQHEPDSDYFNKLRVLT